MCCLEKSTLLNLNVKFFKLTIIYVQFTHNTNYLHNSLGTSLLMHAFLDTQVVGTKSSYI